LGDQELFHLKETAAEQSVQWLAVDASIPDSLLQWVAAKTGLKILRLETSGSSAPTSGISTYLDVCRHNLRQLCRITIE
jgi:ABC-type Zn uptake system ZnuABC Zn-binding protein ZnuA